VDASHPDIAPNFDWGLSRNFVTDIPAVDGPCEYAGCKDPVGVDDGAHGTHVAGTVAAAMNGLGISGVAPEATIVEIRAGQDSGYFFLQETVDALEYAGDAGIDVVNMSFYTDPWLFNCASEADYIEGSTEGILEQQVIRAALIAALDYAHARGATLIAAAGNGASDYDTPTRSDASSPDYPVARRSNGSSPTTASTCRPKARTSFPFRRSARAATSRTTRLRNRSHRRRSAGRLLPRRPRHRDVPDA
jgi:subtilisin family serine protease